MPIETGQTGSPEETGVVISISGDASLGLFKPTALHGGGGTKSGTRSGDGISLTEWKLQYLQNKLLQSMQIAVSLSFLAFRFIWSQRRQEIAQMALMNSRLRLDMAQKRHAETIAKFGPKSDEAVMASRQVEIAQNVLERSQLRVRRIEEHQWVEIIPAGLVVVQNMDRVASWVRRGRDMHAHLHQLNNTHMMMRAARQLSQRTALLVGKVAAQLAKALPVVGLIAFVAVEAWGAAQEAEDIEESRRQQAEVMATIKGGPQVGTDFGQTYDITVTGNSEKEIATRMFSRVREIEGDY